MRPLLLLLVAVPLGAHDFWIDPATFAPRVGQILAVRLRVGQDLMGDPVARDAALVREFISVDRTGRRPLVGRDGADPAGLMRVEDAGLLVIGYFSNPSSVELPAAKFNQYLREEGLNAPAAGRAQRELFSRCAKSLVLAGPAAAAQSDRALGFPLELVAERNPYALRVGEELPVRLTYGGRPLAGTLVIAMNRRDPSAKLLVRSGADGRVRLRLLRDGMWMIKAVHMIPAEPGANADWQSYWASLTFELGAGQ